MINGTRPLTPTYLNTRSALSVPSGPQQALSYTTTSYGQPVGGSDIGANIRTLAINVWTWVGNFLRSAFATLKSASIRRI